MKKVLLYFTMIFLISCGTSWTDEDEVKLKNELCSLQISFNNGGDYDGIPDSMCDCMMNSIMKTFSNYDDFFNSSESGAYTKEELDSWAIKMREDCFPL